MLKCIWSWKRSICILWESLINKHVWERHFTLCHIGFNAFVSCTPPVKSIQYIKSTGRRTLRAQASLLCSNCYKLMAKHGSYSEHFEQQNQKPRRCSCPVVIPVKPAPASSIFHMLIARKIKSYFIDMLYQAYRLYCVLNPYIKLLLTLVRAACLYRRYKIPLPKNQSYQPFIFILQDLVFLPDSITSCPGVFVMSKQFPKKTFVVAFLSLALDYPICIFLGRKSWWECERLLWW